MKPKTESNTASLAIIGVDIGKEIFHLVGLGADGKMAFRRKIKRLALKDAFEKLPTCIVGMEACLSAHFVSRTLRALGHKPRIIPALYVKPFVKGQKNDLYEESGVKGADGQPLTTGVLTNMLAEEWWPPFIGPGEWGIFCRRGTARHCRVRSLGRAMRSCASTCIRWDLCPSPRSLFT